MKATYRLKPYELTDGFFKMMKDAFYDKEITITIEEAPDEPPCRLRSEANRKILLAGAEAVNQGTPLHTT